MKTFKYYRVAKLEQIELSDDVEMFPYAVEGDNKIIGIKAEAHSYDFEELTFAEAKPYIESSHINKELNKLISNRIKESYSADDEIAMLKKDDADADKIAYQNYVDGIKSEVNLKKVEYGLKQWVS
jgi:hypothetical protein